MTISQYNFYPTLTPVRVLSSSNVSGTYFNGPTNNGVKATLTIAASSLTVDSVVVVVGDRVGLIAQTNGNENGIYDVLSIDSTVVLQRSDDLNDIENLKPGLSFGVGAGTANGGSVYTLVEPLPASFGIDSMSFVSAQASGSGVSFSGGASTANALAVFSNTTGDIKAASTTTTLGQALNITGALGVTGAITASTNITATDGPITSGSANNAGSFISNPALAANGTLIVAAVNAGGAFNTTISNGTMGQSTVYTIPDSGDALGRFLVGATATPFISGNFPVASGTGGLMVDSGLAAADIQNSNNIIAATTANIGGAGAGPISVAVAGLTTASVVVGTIESSTNAVQVQTITATATGFDVVFSGDPGASCLLNYVAFIAAQ